MQIAFTRKGDKKFAELDLKNFKLHHKNNIFFENDLIKSAFFELQEHRCTRCDDLKPFRTFFALKEHMRKEHQLFCCDLCIKHIKVRLIAIYIKCSKLWNNKANVVYIDAIA